MDFTVEFKPPPRVRRAGMIARWKPVHLGHAAVLQALTACAEHSLIGIGSSNRYDPPNPFTAEETADMIRLCLPGRQDFELLELPDLGDGPRWRAMVLERFGELDLFATANSYVNSLLGKHYRIVHPVELVAAERRVAVDGTMVRRAMARGEDWKSLVPEPVAAYLEERRLVERFRREFGLATLALDAPGAEP